MQECRRRWRFLGDTDDEVYAELAHRAAAASLTVLELLHWEAARIAARPSLAEWLERTRRRPSPVIAADVVEALDELRGGWPDAGG